MNKIPMKKVTASNLGSGAVGVPLAVVLAAVLQQFGVDLGQEATVALGGVFTWLMGLLASALASD